MSRLDVIVVPANASRPRTFEDRQDLSLALSFLNRADRRIARESGTKAAVRLALRNAQSAYLLESLSFEVCTDLLGDIISALAKARDERVCDNLAVAYSAVLRLRNRVTEDLSRAV